MSTIQFQQVVVPEGVIDLGVGQPNNAILPIQHVRRAAEAQFAASAEFLQYGAEWGDGHHRLALGEWLTRVYGVSVDPEDLFSTNGNSQALEMLSTLFAEPGDVVLVEEPTYFLAFQMFRDHGLQVRGVGVDHDGPVVDALRDAVDEVRNAGQRVAFFYMIPAFQNPTGVTTTAARRDELAALAQELDVLVVADEVYHLLRYAPGDMPPPMSAYVHQAPVLSIGTFSKILAPGLRLGWVHGSFERLRVLADSGLILSGGGLNPVPSTLATEMIRRGWQDEYLDWLRATFARRSATMVTALRAHVPDVVEYDVPEGGYFVWLRLPPGVDGAAVRKTAKDHGVDVRHGAQFSPVGALSNHVRLSYAYYDDADIAEGVRRLGRALHTSLPHRLTH